MNSTGSSSPFTYPAVMQRSIIDKEERGRRRKRLKAVIISRLKDARDVLETKEALTKSWKIGGMEFSSEDAEGVVKETEKAREALQEELKLLNATMQQSANTSMRMRDREIASRSARNDNVGKQDLSVPEIEAPQEQRLASSVEGTGPEKFKKINISEISLTANRSTLNAPAGRPAVDSVASTIPSAFGKPKLMGPVEELGSMSLEEFRRLGSTLDAVRKINDKVELLAADSLLEKKKGIDAWKNSEVYKLYMLIGTESLEKKIGVADVIQARQKQNAISLTVEEFAAIADLNRKISFSS